MPLTCWQCTFEDVRGDGVVGEDLTSQLQDELVDACMTKNAIMADKQATSFSCFAMPMATPTKMIGKLPKMMLPASLMMVSRNEEWSHYQECFQSISLDGCGIVKATRRYREYRPAIVWLQAT